MKRIALLPLLLAFACSGAVASTSATPPVNEKPAEQVSSFYDASGYFFLQLDVFIYYLLRSPAQDTSIPSEINDLPLVTLNESPHAYDWVLAP